jgi:hypothetical protein
MANAVAKAAAVSPVTTASSHMLEVSRGPACGAGGTARRRPAGGRRRRRGRTRRAGRSARARRRPGRSPGTHGVGPDGRGEQQPADPVLPDEDRPQDQQSGQPDDEQPLAADRQGGQHAVVPERVGPSDSTYTDARTAAGYADGPQRPVGRLPGPSTPHGARDDLAHGDSIGQPAGTLQPCGPTSGLASPSGVSRVAEGLVRSLAEPPVSGSAARPARRPWTPRRGSPAAGRAP